MSDQRAIHLQQLANIVINAYLNRHNRFKPNFGKSAGIMYLERPKGDQDHPDLQLGFMYRKSDYEPEDQS
jgi:hypothetical protein